MTEVYKTPISQLNAALKWNSENKEYMCDYVKKWNLNHPERAKATYKRTYEKNKDDDKFLYFEYAGENTFGN